MPAPVPTSGQDPEQKTVIRVYGAFVASVLMMFVPQMGFAVVSLLFFTGVLIAGYILRGKADGDGLQWNHMTYVIRTIWISALFAFIVTLLGGAYLWTQVDTGAVMPCAQPMQDYVMAQGENVQMMELYALFAPCIEPLIQANWNALMIATMISAGPVVLYLIFRLSHGILRATKGYRVKNPKAWF